jgi:hypothetical protein
MADKGLLFGYAGAIVAVFILDAVFFMAWAPEWWLVPVFLLIGVVMRLTTVAAGPIMQVVAKDVGIAREARMIRGLSIAAGIFCLIPALSFFAGGHYNQTHSSSVAVATEGVSDTNKAARIATLQTQIARIEKGRDDSISEANMSIQLIAQDGVPGISPADNQNIALLRAEIQKYRTGADAQINGLETQIAGIEQEKETVQTSSATAQAKVSPVYAIFEVLGSAFGSSAGWAMTVLFGFAFIIEAIAFFGLGAYQGLHKLFVAAIQRMELEEAAHEARLEVEAQRVKDKIAAEALLERANADLELAVIEAAAKRARERADAARAGEDPDLNAPLKAAEADRKAAEIEAEVTRIRAEAEALRKPKPEEPTWTDAQQRARDAAKANSQKNKADQIEDEILVNDNRVRNANRESARSAP